MKIAVASDHEGFRLKEKIIPLLEDLMHEVVDLGCHSREPVDYPDYALHVGRALREGGAERGILICGSGAGACIAANKIAGIRAALCHDVFTAHQSVEHDDANVMCLGSNIVGDWLAAELVVTWINARFSGLERHRRRLEKIRRIEGNQGSSPAAA